MALKALREALVAIYNADATVQGVTGRTSRNLVARGAVTEGPYPIVTYFVVSGPKAAGTNGRRRVRIQVDAWADLREATSDPIADLESLIDRARALFTSPSLAAKGVDASVGPIGNRRDGLGDEGIRCIAEDFIFEVAE